MAFSGILLIIEWFTILPVAIRSKASISLQIEYLIFRFPSLLLLTTPFALLFSTIYTFNRLEVRKEITAMCISGIAPFRISLPILLLSLGLTIGSFLKMELVVVDSNRKASKLLEEISGVKEEMEKRDVSLYGCGGKRLYHFGLFNNIDGRIDDVTILGQGIRIDARMARWKKDGWYLFDGVIRRFDENLLWEGIEWFDLRKGDIHETKEVIWKVLSSRRLRSEDMSLKELIEYIRILGDFGKKRSDKITDFHLRFSIPFINLIVVIFGTGISLMNRGRMTSFGTSLLVAFLYWVAIATSRSLGHGGIVPPWISAWGPNILFLLIGVGVWHFLKL